MDETGKNEFLHTIIPSVVGYLLSTLVISWVFSRTFLEGDGPWEVFQRIVWVGLIWIGLWWVFRIATAMVVSVLDPAERAKARQQKEERRAYLERHLAKEAERRAEEAERLEEKDLRREAAELHAQSKRVTDRNAAFRRERFDKAMCAQFEVELIDEGPSDSSTFRCRFHGELLEGERLEISAGIDLRDEHGELASGPGNQMGRRVRTTFSAKRLVTVETINNTNPKAVGFTAYSCVVHDFVSPHRKRP